MGDKKFIGPGGIGNLIEKKFALYGFILYGSDHEEFGDWIHKRGGWINKISGPNCLMEVNENPKYWGKKWHAIMQEYLGDNYDEIMKECESWDESYRDMSYDIAERLNIENKELPCFVFTENLNSNKCFNLLIVDNKDELSDYFEDVFDIVKAVIKDKPNDLPYLNKELFNNLNNTWIRPEKLKNKGKPIIRWANAIKEVQSPIIDIITDWMKVVKPG